MFAFWKLTTGVVGSVMVTVCSVPPAAASSGGACTAIAAELAAKTPVTPRAQRRASMCNASRSPDWVRAPLVHRLFPPDCRDGSHSRSVPSRESRVSPGTPMFHEGTLGVTGSDGPQGPRHPRGCSASAPADWVPAATW